MRNKLKRQEAVVFPVKANGTKNMASVFKIFFPSVSYLDSVTLGDEKWIAVPGGDHDVLALTLAPSPGHRAWLHFS